MAQHLWPQPLSTPSFIPDSRSTVFLLNPQECSRSVETFWRRHEGVDREDTPTTLSADSVQTLGTPRPRLVAPMKISSVLIKSCRYSIAYGDASRLPLHPYEGGGSWRQLGRGELPRWFVATVGTGRVACDLNHRAKRLGLCRWCSLY